MGPGQALIYPSEFIDIQIPEIVPIYHDFVLMWFGDDATLTFVDDHRFNVVFAVKIGYISGSDCVVFIFTILVLNEV
jgi:hypothetical protein